MDRKFLEKNNFQVHGQRLSRRLRFNEDLSEVLSLLHKKGMVVVDVETKKPTLEDYFVKILEKQEGKK